MPTRYSGRPRQKPKVTMQKTKSKAILQNRMENLAQASRCPSPKWLADAEKLRTKDLTALANTLEFRVSVFREVLSRRKGLSSGRILLRSK